MKQQFKYEESNRETIIRTNSSNITTNWKWYYMYELYNYFKRIRYIQ